MARTTAEIQLDLDAAYAARRSALQAQSYSLDTGQGRQQVERANLTEIKKQIRELEAEMAEAIDPEGGLLSATLGRY